VSAEGHTVDHAQLYALLVNALRYAFGRNTYVVDEMCDAIRQWWPVLRGAERSVVLRDIERHIGDCGDAWKPRAEWTALVAWCKEQP
jgi:hypothetical protein